MSQDEPIDASLQSLLAAARRIAGRAYAPYSGFKVGAALQLANGAIATGANVENVSYGLTICAERAALARAVAEHGPGIRIHAIAVANLNDAPSPPCGACRQMLAEFAEPDAPVIFATAEGLRTLPLSALLPLAFNTNLK
jgi:homotetrameric cytidine deaminase